MSKTSLLLLAAAPLLLDRVPLLQAANCLEEFEHCAFCHIYSSGESGSCGYKVTDEDVTASCGSEDYPCITKAFQVYDQDPRCLKCAKVTMIEPGSTDAQVCEDGLCPAYTKEVYVKAVDSTEEATFAVSQTAWEVVCPYVCAGGSTCVQDPSVCVHGHFEGANAHCSAGSKEIKWEEVACGQGGPEGDATRTAVAGTLAISTMAAALAVF